MSQKSFTFSLGCLLMCMVGIALPLAAWKYVAILTQTTYYPIARFDFESDRTITIIAPDQWEVGIPLFYSVRVGGTEVIERARLRVNSPVDPPEQLKLRAVRSPDGLFVGVMYEDSPSDHFLILHDFSRNDSWPHNDDYGCEERLKKALLSGDTTKVLPSKLRSERTKSAKGRKGE